MNSEKFVRLVSAPTGSGKSYAFMRAVLERKERVLFIVPTRRLLQNLMEDARSQARQALRESGRTGDQARSWANERIVEWSGGQVPAPGQSLPALRTGQFLDSAAEGVLFAIPEVVLSMISGVRVKGGSTINPFLYLRLFDHVVFDEFHTIDDRSFGLAALFARLALEEKKAKVSFLSATPVDIRSVLARMGVLEPDMEQIVEEVVGGHPSGHRPVHGDVDVTLSKSSLAEILSRSQELVRRTIEDGRAVILVYDSLRRLKQEEPSLRASLREAGIGEDQVLAINSLDDSRTGPGERPHEGGYEDPMKYGVLIATSSVEVGVTFRSTLMMMEPGHSLASFIQRVGRVSRGKDHGRVIVSLLDERRNRTVWARRIADVVDSRDAMDVQAFTAEVLRDVRRRLSGGGVGRSAADGAVESADFDFYRSVSWRGAFWAALFLVAVEQTRMRIQRASRKRLREMSPPIAHYVRARIEEILSVRIVDDCLPEASQPHKRWVEALFQQALSYRDIGATFVIVDPDGTRRRARESFLRQATGILDRELPTVEDGEQVVYLQRRGLDEEIRTHRPSMQSRKMVLRIRSPIGGRSFTLMDNERDRSSERFCRRVVAEWRKQFRPALSAEGDLADPGGKVLVAASALVERLGSAPSDEDYGNPVEG